jgi:hypothetical protein
MRGACASHLCGADLCREADLHHLRAQAALCQSLRD